MRGKQKQKQSPSVKDYWIIQEPIVTEKASITAMTGNRHVFRVPISATKRDIRQAVERVFDVTVEKVNTCRFIGKIKRSPRSARSAGRQAGYKKAYVTLKEGDSISIVEGL